MQQYFGFMSPAEQEKRKKEQLYQISEHVTNFFWDDAPNKYGFEEREGQNEMAFEILDAIKDNRHIVVEAGVGIGKSFAYLVPLLYYNQITQAPVVIATSTIALQEQLYDDVLRLGDLLNIHPSVCLFKGQTNYVCKQRAVERLSNSKDSFEWELLNEILSGTFDRRNFSVEIHQALWDKINIYRYSRHTCNKCSYRDECGYYRMRLDLPWNHGFVLCNQDILTAHLKKVSQGAEGLLPLNTGTIVVDEAHNLEGRVRNATTIRLSQRAILSIAEASIKDLHGLGMEYISRELTEVKRSVNAFYSELNQQMQDQISDSEQDMKYADRFFFRASTRALHLLENASDDLEQLATSVDINASRDLRRMTNNTAPDDLMDISKSLQELTDHFSNYLVWIERDKSGAALLYCPKNMKDVIRRLYFNGKVKTILTSATITSSSVGSLEEQYSYFIRNTGFPTNGRNVLSEPKPSPFPYDKHAMVYYCKDLPHPTREHDSFIDAGVCRLVELLDISHGRALVLFTAKTDMEEVFARLKAMELPYKILMQQPGSSQDRVLQEFRNDVDSVLLGSGAYWEGISIEGKSLSHLVVFRLPFPIPDPIIEYKSSIAKDPLMQVQVPEMIIKLKQGIGRLIRSFSDKGIVSIIDSRLRDNRPTPYHDITWDALPIKNRTDDIQVIRQFYDGLALEE